MLAGDKKFFAIEYSLDEEFRGKWLFGKIAFWIQGYMVGDYNSGTSLTDILGFITNVVKYSGQRYVGDLCNLPPDVTFDLIERAIYRDDFKQFDKYVEDPLLRQVPGVLMLTPSVDVFDHCAAYLIECADHEKIIYKTNLNSSSVNHAVLTKGYTEPVARQFYQWLDRLYGTYVYK